MLSANEQLDEVITRIKSEKYISTAKGYGTGPISAYKARNIGFEAFKNKEYLSALRNLEYYITNTHIPDYKNLCKTHLIMAKSAHRLGKYEGAFNHYLEFLSLSTTPGTSSNIDIRDAIAELLSLSVIVKPRKMYQLSQILSSIVSLDLEPSLRSEVLFLAAKSATNFNMPELAEKWINEAKNSAGGSSVRLKGQYYQALIELSAGNKEMARVKLLEALEAYDGDPTSEEYGISQLALARIAYSLNDLNEAIKYYKSISELTTSFVDGSYELIYAYFKNGDNKAALEQAKLFTKMHPNHSNAKFSNTLTAYLGIKAGELPETETSIDQDIKFLSTFKNELRGKLNNPETLEIEDLESIKDNSFSFANQSPYLERSIIIFKRLAALEQLAAKVQGKISSLHLDLWNANLHDILPKHIGRSHQLKEAVVRLLDIGNKLSLSEFSLAKTKMSKANQISFERSANRRTSLSNKKNNFMRYKNNLAHTIQLISVEEKLQKIQKKLIKSGLRYATNSYLGRSTTDNNIKFEMNSQNLKLNKITSKLSSAIISHRKQHLKNLHLQTPISSIKHLLSTYTLDLITESRLLAEWRNLNNSPLLKKLSWQFHDTWMKWFDAADFIFHQLVEEQEVVDTEIKNLVKVIKSSQEQKQNLLTKIFNLRSQLATKLGVNSSLLLSHYSNAAEMRISEKQKWLADLEWLKYKTANKESLKMREQYEQEKMILHEDLTDQIRGTNR